LVPTVPIPLVEIVDKALAYDKENRWSDARVMRQAVQTAYRAITGTSPSAARLSVADDSTRISEEDTVAAASKVPTSLTVAHDSASFCGRRPRHVSRFRRLAVFALLGGGAYVAFAQPSRVALRALFAGRSATNPIDVPGHASPTATEGAPAAV